MGRLDLMSTSCSKHGNVVSNNSCGQCTESYCDDCLVFPFGQRKPPMCISCALSFSGVRQRNDAVPTERKERKRLGRKKRVIEVSVAAPSDHFDANEPFFVLPDRV